jgi:small-conductance mechanosensitive channel
MSKRPQIRDLCLGAVLFAGLFLGPFPSEAQRPQATVASADTADIPPMTVEAIPLQVLQTELKLDNILDSLISEDQLLAEKAELDSILTSLDRYLDADKKVSLDSILSRELGNMRHFWNGYKVVLAKQEEEIQAIISELSSKSKIVNEDLRFWRNANTSLDFEFTDSLYRESVRGAILLADSVSSLLLARSSIAYSALKSLKQYSYELDRLLSEIRDVVRSRQEKVLEKTHPSLLTLNYSEGSQWHLLARARAFKDNNVTIVTRYYFNNIINVYIYAAYTALLLGFFVFLKRRSPGIDASPSNVYLKALDVILQRPISVAIILAVFSSGIFFPDRPPILIDLSILVLTLPIIDLVAHVSNRKARVYLYFLGLLILLRFFNYIYPPTTPIHRLNLLVMGGLELALMLALFRKLNIAEMTSKAFNQFVRIIILIHILASVTGIAANFTGHLRLSEIAVDLPITNTLVGLLLVISTLVLVGLLHLAIDGNFLKRFLFIRKRHQLLKRRIMTISMLVVSFLWLNYILQILRINEFVYQFIQSLLGRTIALGTISFSIGGVLLFFFIIWLSVMVSDMIKAVLDDDVLSKVSLKKGVPRMISVIVRFSIISAGLFLAVGAVGMPLNQLTIILGAFSVGIGFGLQNVVNNFVSGLILLFERPVQIGDTVEVNNLIGQVKSMGIRSSNIRSFDGAEVVVPNANLISNEVINWTLSDKKRRIEVFSGVAYGSDVHRVKEILMGILNRHPDILKEPAPLVLFNDLGESSLDFRLLFWTDNYDKWIVIKSEVIFEIYDALNAAEIKIPFPQRDLHININDIGKNG